MSVLCVGHLLGAFQPVSIGIGDRQLSRASAARYMSGRFLGQPNFRQGSQATFWGRCKIIKVCRSKKWAVDSGGSAHLGLSFSLIGC